MTPRRYAAIVALAVVALAAGPAGRATTVSAPPPIAHLTVEQHTDHAVEVAWYNPAAVYGPGGGLTVRWANGATAAPSPTAGYPAPVIAGHTSTVSRLNAASAITFTVWVHDGSGRYSPPRSVTTTTSPDTTPPPAPTNVRWIDSRALPGATAPVQLTFQPPTITDLAGVEVVRSPAPGLVGASLVGMRAVSPVTDVGAPRTGALYYYVRSLDIAGNASSYVRVDLPQGTRTVSGLVNESWNPLVFAIDAAGNETVTQTSEPYWSMAVPDGTYAVCGTYTIAAPTPEFVGGCLTGTGSIVAWDGDPAAVPAAARSVIVLSADRSDLVLDI